MKSQRIYEDYLKRALDLLVAGSLIVFLSPVLAIAAATILLSMGRPIIYRQNRPGLKGRPFTILKFRTMIPESYSGETSLPDEERITPIGRFLRSTSIDELPELWNVLRGEMSLVGPRPLLMQYVHQYDSLETRRQDVRPGITGLAQIRGRNALSWKRRFYYDAWYSEHVSICLDLRILKDTLSVVLRRQGIAFPTSGDNRAFASTPGNNQESSG